MASTTTNNYTKHQQQQQSMHHSTYESSLTTNNNTTFVQANPSNFRAIVQHLTGSNPTATSGGPARKDGSDVASFKLHERRQQQGAIRKLEMIKLNNYSNVPSNYNHGPMNGLARAKGGNEVAMISPVSTLDGLELGLGSPSPRTNPRSCMSEEEERVVIAEKRFYLHPVGSPLSGNTGTRDCEPQLLPLFPLHSPRDGQN